MRKDVDGAVVCGLAAGGRGWCGPSWAGGIGGWLAGVGCGPDVHGRWCAEIHRVGKLLSAQISAVETCSATQGISVMILDGVFE